MAKKTSTSRRKTRSQPSKDASRKLIEDTLKPCPHDPATWVDLGENNAQDKRIFWCEKCRSLKKGGEPRQGRQFSIHYDGIASLDPLKIEPESLDLTIDPNAKERYL